MKKEYNQPTIEKVEFENEDVITTSGTGILGGILPGDTNQDWGSLV